MCVPQSRAQQPTIQQDSLQQVLFTEPPRTPESVPLFEKFIRENAPSDSAFIALQRLLAPHIQAKRWNLALKSLREFSSLFPNRSKSIQRIQNIISLPDTLFLVSNAGSAINSEENDFAPVPYMQNYPPRLFFTRSSVKGNTHAEEPFVADFELVAWRYAKRLQAEAFSATISESPSYISANGNLMLFSRVAVPKSADNFSRVDKSPAFALQTNNAKQNTEQRKATPQIVATNGRGGVWRAAYYLPEEINSPYWQADAHLTENAKAIIFSSDMPVANTTPHPKPNNESGSYNGDRWGNTDLYVCVKTAGGWSEPINLGNRINTRFAERTPYLSPDEKTLYFSSDGHAGLGKLDVFRSERLNMESWTEWSEPENLGKEINSADDDWGFKETGFGDSAFFASRNRLDGYGANDIYIAKLAPPPTKYTTVKGYIHDYKNKPLVADLRFIDATDNPFFLKAKTDSNGLFEISLPRGRDYIWSSKKEGYYPLTKNFRISVQADSVLDSLDMTLLLMHDNPTMDTSVIHIQNILFENNSDVVREQYYSELRNVVNYMQGKATLSIDITGHTDSKGNPEHNKNLSRRRAQAVRNFLITMGCKAERLFVTGLGASTPLADNESEEGKALNRRVEIRLKY